jgi:hypothetical protein
MLCTIRFGSSEPIMPCSTVLLVQNSRRQHSRFHTAGDKEHRHEAFRATLH